MEDVPEPPGGMASKLFSDEMEKSGPVTITVTSVACDRLHPLEPPTPILCSPGAALLGASIDRVATVVPSADRVTSV